jgi:hypothetical protein
MNPRPGWLSAVCVVAIVLGGLGLMTSLLGAAGTIFAPQVQAWTQKWTEKMTQGRGQPPGIQEMQEKMQAKVLEVQARWRAANLAVVAANLVLSSCLLFGGIKAMQLSPAGRTVLLFTFGAIILFHGLRMIPNIGMQLATADVMNNIMNISMKAGIAFSIAWMVMIELVQVTAYALGIWYLRRPHIRALYANQEGAATVEALPPTPGEPLA